MWDSLGKIFTSDNGVAVILFMMFAMFFVGYLVNKGHIHFKNNVLSVGDGEHERTILRYQSEYAYNFVSAWERDIEKPGDWDDYRGKYIFMLVMSEINRWLMFNHLEASESYIRIKTETVLHIIRKRSDLEFVRSDEFETVVYVQIDRLIRRLIDIRKQYSRG